MTKHRAALMAVAGVVVVLAALATSQRGSVAGPALAVVAVVLVVGTGLAALVVRAERRVTSRQRRLEKQIGSLADKIAVDHKRAAVWNYHLRHDLGLPGSVPPDGGLPTIGSPVTSSTAVDGGRRSDTAPWRGLGLGSTILRPGRLTVVVGGVSEAMIRETLDSVMADAESVDDLELLVAGPDAGPDAGDVRRLGRIGSSTVETRNDGLRVASGTVCLLLDAGVQLRPGSLRAVVEAFEDPGVLAAQPVILDGDGLIRTAGCHFAARNALPAPLLAGMPASDAERLAGVRLAAADGAALAVRTADARAVGGFDPELGGRWSVVDLCLRTRTDGVDRVVAVPGASLDQVVDVVDDEVPQRRAFLRRWAGELPQPSGRACEVAGLTTAYVSTDGRRVAAPVPLLVRDRRDIRTRWGIKISSPPGRHGVRWGDTHFATALRAALERQGHVAVVHPWGAHDAPAAGLDDVHLVLRGKRRVMPVPGKVNVLWVISHPDAVTVEEVLGFDAVFAASASWAQEMTARSGRPVSVLLQATDSTAFGPDGPVVPVDAPLFVGGVHPGRERSVVGAALTAGVPLAVYGHGWDDVLPAGYLRGTYVNPADLPAYYRGAPRVLADHWPAMAAHGFVQNRVFDAVASGAPVISDLVADLEDVFGGAVPTYSGPAELAELCGPGGDAAFPTADERVRLARRTCREHSFDARASRLVEVVPAPEEVIRCS